MRESDDTPARRAASSNRATASLAALSFSSRCDSMKDAGTVPMMVGGITGS